MANVSKECSQEKHSEGDGFVFYGRLIFEMGMMVHFQREEINVSVTGLYNCICFSDIYSPSSACETTATG